MSRFWLSESEGEQISKLKHKKNWGRFHDDDISTVMPLLMLMAMSLVKYRLKLSDVPCFTFASSARRNRANR